VAIEDRFDCITLYLITSIGFDWEKHRQVAKKIIIILFISPEKKN
jgi:hypothetical protein